MGSYIPTNRICIIGAGPSGLASAKFLLAEKTFERIDVFEQTDDVGGVWHVTPSDRTKRIPFPQLNPCYGQPNSSGETLEFESPMYDYLETNIPKSIMAYNEKPFPDSEPLFPSHQAVLRYLEEYAADIRHMIKFHTQVQDVSLSNASELDRDIWTVKWCDLRTGINFEQDYDAVVVGNGHYTIPNIPLFKGLAEWNQSYAGVLIHSKAYRRPEEFHGKKVLVIGSSASGTDIAMQLWNHCKLPVLLSSRSVGVMGSKPDSKWLKNVDEVEEFLPSDKHDRAVRFKDGSIESHLDSVIFCTGYYYSYPFLSSLKPPIVSDGLRVQDNYRHLFSIAHPTLVFPVINLKVLPFPLVENQAAVFARVWSGRLSLPPQEKMRKWQEDIIQDRGNGKYFHVLKFPEDAIMMNELYDWAAQAVKVPGLENGGQGKLGSRWDADAVWKRSQFPKIKSAFNELGEGRKQVRTISELGFDFEPWLRMASRSDKQFLVDAGFEVD